jgi:hypothetical protein
MAPRLNLVNLTAIAVFTVIFALSLYLKLFPTLNYNFPFTMDQARDMLDIRQMVEQKKPALIGPTTSINGVFLGPFYYYFNLPPYLISGGDPAYLTYWNLAWYMLAGAAVLFYFYKKDKSFSIISSVTFLMAPAFFYSSRYFWSANPMPYLTAFYVLSFVNFLNKTTALNASFIGLIAGLSMQVEAAFGVLFLPFFVIFSLIKRLPLKSILSAIGIFFLTLVPQIIFELRHDFLMSKTFINEVTGSSQILGDKLSFAETFSNHFSTFTDFSSGQYEIPATASMVLLLISVIFLGFRSFTKKLDERGNNLFQLCLSFVFFAFASNMLYSHPLKGWYLLGLRVFYLFIVSLFLNDLFKIKFPLFKVLVILFLGWSFTATYLSQERFIPKATDDRSTDKSNLRNEIEAIDWVYQKADGRGFKSYNYIPSVYDYPYQYLYWWYGGKKYGYHPETVTYMDNVPEYIKDNDTFLTLKKPSDNSFIFLIYEPDTENEDRLAAWLGNFTKFCTKDRRVYLWGTTVEYREPCPTQEL